MNISDGLKLFVHSAIRKEKRTRVISSLSNSKNHKKFAQSLDHDFLKFLDSQYFTTPVDIKSLVETGFIYCSNGFSSEVELGIVELYETAPWEGGWLIVNTSGSFGIYRPEGKIDDEVYIKP